MRLKEDKANCSDKTEARSRGNNIVSSCANRRDHSRDLRWLGAVVSHDGVVRLGRARVSSGAVVLGTGNAGLGGLLKSGRLAFGRGAWGAGGSLGRARGGGWGAAAAVAGGRVDVGDRRRSVVAVDSR